MILALVALVCGALLGIARGGRLHRLRSVRVRKLPLLVGGLGIWLAVAITAPPAPEIALATSLALLVAAAVANLHLPGMGVVAVGLLLRLAPLLLNGAVPLDADALAAADRDPTTAPPGHVLVDDAAPLAVLSQRIPVPEIGAVLSFGDLVVLVGLVDAAAHATRRRRRGGIPARELLAAELHAPVSA
ncbi:MAG TPA: DUF5317 family protein [Acidimicrobiales bacterium]|nr:DUF5317 family protein [Acidimicrobiales bacterium]